MLRTRLWMGAILVLLAAAMLACDQMYQPYYPFLLLFVLVLGPVACLELLQLLGPERRPPGWFCLLAILSVLLANWPAHLLEALARALPGMSWPAHLLVKDPPAAAWNIVLAVYTAVVLATFLLEMATFKEPGHSVQRIAVGLLIVAYLGLLPSFLVQQRWLPQEDSSAVRGVAALALTIFVPKMCDIGAFFTGTLIGRHKMTPILSPKKTWEGFVGGMVVAVLTAVVLNRHMPVLRGADLAAVGFGLTVGLAGVFGDLAESLIKRDCRQKDAGQTVPGFGGVLDVVDSILFAAPVAYCWLRTWS